MIEASKTPKVLHRDVFLGGGPYVEFHSFETPLFHPFGPPDSKRQRGPHYGLFFEFADDLLGSVCSITHQYSPFSPYDNTYYVPNLKQFRSRAKVESVKVQRVGSPYSVYPYYGLLSELRNPIEDWRGNLLQVRGEIIRRHMDYWYEPLPDEETLREDLIATMDYLLEKIDEAQACSHTVSVIGF